MVTNQPIANLTPHYTNERFRNPQTVWLADGHKIGKDGYVKGAKTYEYSDRLWQWNWDKAKQATDVIDKNLDRRSAAYIQEFLRFFYGKPNITLVHVMAGFNVSTGYPYQIYGYVLEVDDAS